MKGLTQALSKRLGLALLACVLVADCADDDELTRIQAAELLRTEICDRSSSCPDSLETFNQLVRGRLDREEAGLVRFNRDDENIASFYRQDGAWTVVLSKGVERQIDQAEAKKRQLAGTPAEGLTVGMSQVEVIEKLGEPRTRVRMDGGFTRWTYYSYDEQGEIAVRLLLVFDASGRLIEISPL